MYNKMKVFTVSLQQKANVIEITTRLSDKIKNFKNQTFKSVHMMSKYVQWYLTDLLRG